MIQINEVPRQSWTTTGLHPAKPRNTPIVPSNNSKQWSMLRLHPASCIKTLPATLATKSKVMIRNGVVYDSLSCDMLLHYHIVQSDLALFCKSISIADSSYVSHNTRKIKCVILMQTLNAHIALCIHGVLLATICT